MSIRMTITIEDELYSELEKSSKDNERSISQEITYRCRKFSEPVMSVTSSWDPSYKAPEIETTYATYEGKGKGKRVLISKKGVKELPSQDVGGLKTYFKEKKK